MPRCRAGLILLLGLALGVAPAAAQPNLLVNGGGERDVGGSGYTNVPPTGWQVLAGGPTVTLYDAFGANYFGARGPGLNYIAGGNNRAVSTMTQTVDVSGDGETIDAGTAPFTLCGYLGGFGGQSDAAAVTVTFQDGAAAVFGSAAIGPVTPADRNFTTALCLASVSGTIPAGTRALTVTATLTRVSGGYDDAYVDELTLVLGAECPVSGGGCSVTTTSTSSSTSTSAPLATTTSTSSSTLAPPSTLPLPRRTCATGATQESIACRLDALVDDVTQASDLGAMRQALVGQATTARDRVAQIPDATMRGKRRALAKATLKKLTALSHRLAARKAHTIPAATRERLGSSQVAPLRTDLAAYRKSL